MRLNPLRLVLFALTLTGGAKVATVLPLPASVAGPLAVVVAGGFATIAEAADPPAPVEASDEAEASGSSTEIASDADPATAPPDTEGHGASDGVVGDEAVCPAPEEMLALLDQERDAIAAQRADLAAEREEIAAARARLEADAADLAILRDELRTLVEGVERARSADLDRLVNLYRGMKPKQAAAIVADLDLGVTIAILGAMAERDAAPILAQLDPIHAGAISRILLERGKLPDERDLSGLRLR